MYTYWNWPGNTTISAADQDILKIMRALDINKVHGHENVSARIIKIWKSSIVSRLNNFLQFYKFLNLSRQLENIKYCISLQKRKQAFNTKLLPIINKIFERLIFNSLYKFVEENSLFCSNESGFRNWFMCKSILSIKHKIYESFDSFPSLKRRSKFLYMSIAFNRVWHEGLI